MVARENPNCTSGSTAEQSVRWKPVGDVRARNGSGSERRRRISLASCPLIHVAQIVSAQDGDKCRRFRYIGIDTELMKRFRVYYCGNGYPCDKIEERLAVDGY